MAKNIFNSIRDYWKGKNKFNTAFFSFYGGGSTSYDIKNQTYLDKGFNFNNDIYSIISKQATKTSSIPLVIKKIEDEQAKSRLDVLSKSTKGNLTPLQKVKKRALETKAYEGGVLELPLDKPNPFQTWTEFNYLYKVFLKTNGNVYIYKLCAEDGLNKGVPKAFYLLPSQDIEIVLRDDIGMLDLESPVKSYMLIQGEQYLEFEAEKVTHIRYANPNYDMYGAHLYGQSPLKAALRTMQSSNKAVDLNNKTLESGGAFGFFFGKDKALTPEQAQGFKDRLKEMQNSPEDLAKIAGSSAEMGFQRISLTTDELKPFEFLKYDQKQFCNALGYSDKLLNNDDGGKYDNVSQFRRQIITDDIKPDLMMLEDGFWSAVLPLFKGYKNTVAEYDISELPEMQEDMEMLVNWAVKLKQEGALNKNELRGLATFPKVDDPNMDVYTVSQDELTVEEAIESSFNLDNEPKE